MKVLVTGGTGFLGQKLAKRLISMNIETTVVGRNNIVGNSLKNNGIHFKKGSLEDKIFTLELCKDMDYVFHCAALSSPWGKYKEFYNSNVLSTRNIIDGCIKYNVKRLIHTSTPSIYFDFTDKFQISEKDILPQKFVNYYAETKFEAEKELDKGLTRGLPTIAIRPRALFGPNDTTIIPRIIRANEKSRIPIIDGGNSVIDITYVENVVDALILCMNSPEHTLGKKYNITNDEPIHLITLLEKLFMRLEIQFKTKNISFQKAYKLAGTIEFIYKNFFPNKEPILTKYSVGVLAKSQTLDISAAKKDLIYIPKVSIEQGLDLFVDWWKKENPKYEH